MRSGEKRWKTVITVETVKKAGWKNKCENGEKRLENGEEEKNGEKCKIGEKWWGGAMAIATQPPLTNSPSMHDRLILNDPTTTKKI